MIVFKMIMKTNGWFGKWKIALKELNTLQFDQSTVIQYGTQLFSVHGGHFYID